MEEVPPSSEGVIHEEALDQRNVVELVHAVLSGLDLEGATVLDGTAGNGHDTAFLAERVGPKGRVIAVDIASDAVDATRARIQAAEFTARVQLVHGDHRELHSLVPELAQPALRAAVFNLGYHPGGDHTRSTHERATVPALDAVLASLFPGGVLCVAAYTGHANGRAEADAVMAWAENAARHGLAAEARLIRDAGYELESRPEVVVLTKR